MKTWRVGGGVAASMYVGEFEAATWQEAVEKAYKVAGVSICNECAKHINDPEIDHLWAEDVETGDCTSEPTLGDQVSEQAREIERLRDTLCDIREWSESEHILRFDDGDIALAEYITNALDSIAKARGQE